MNPAKLLSQAWLVLLLAILYGGGLAFVNTTLSPLIAENIRNETYSLIPELVGNPETYNVTEEPIQIASGDTVVLYKVTDDAESGIGWVIPATELGFADKIQILVGVDSECSSILGMKVIDQKETPGLGNLIVADAFTSQFTGKSTSERLEVIKTEPSKEKEILAVTGATISSVTVADAVNSAIGYAKPHILKAN
jgi:electron transport complex protein RnfG